MLLQMPDVRGPLTSHWQAIDNSGIVVPVCVSKDRPIYRTLKHSCVRFPLQLNCVCVLVDTHAHRVFFATWRLDIGRRINIL